MKTVILCGGLGTRLAEETGVRPKPMVKIGDKPILWHIMKIYEKYNHNDFILALGYLGDFIKEYFLNYHNLSSDFEINLRDGKVKSQTPNSENWNIKLKDTGLLTLTGGRLLRLKNELKDEKTFMLTYGDGLSDINIEALLKFHKAHGKIATVSAVHPTARFGGLDIKNNQVIKFKEKPQSGEGFINGGFFVFENKIFDYLENDKTILEKEPLEKLSLDNELMAYTHNGFWQCMDTIREKQILNDLLDKGNPPWLK